MFSRLMRGELPMRASDTRRMQGDTVLENEAEYGEASCGDPSCVDWCHVCDDPWFDPASGAFIASKSPYAVVFSTEAP